MEAPSSSLQAPDTIARIAIRERPQIRIAPDGPVSEPAWIEFRHPANNLGFLYLPAHDYCPPTFGVHYGTAITACQILACNKKGYLSTSRDRNNADGRIKVDMDSIISGERYYYHLSSPGSESLYLICCDFSSWTFPHEDFPLAWKNPSDETRSSVIDWPSNWTLISEVIRRRDMQCLVSEFKDSLTTSYVVPKIHELSLMKNNMSVYLPPRGGYVLSHSPRNLFTLRHDLRLGQFDQANFVIVPKLGQLVVHFLQPTHENAELYHNVRFDHESRLSHEALYARFAWALMKNAEIVLEAVKGDFRFLTASGTSGSDREDGSRVEGSGGRGDEGGGRSRRGRGGRGRGGRSKGGHGGVKRKHGEENEGDELCYGGSNWGSSNRAMSDSEELEEDMKKAARTLPFFLDPNGNTDPYYYETLPWYAGIGIVERRKRAYFDAHPEIRAHSDQLLPDDYDSDV